MLFNVIIHSMLGMPKGLMNVLGISHHCICISKHWDKVEGVDRIRGCIRLYELVSLYALYYFVLRSCDFTHSQLMWLQCGCLFLWLQIRAMWPKASWSEQFITWPQLLIQEWPSDPSWANEIHLWDFLLFFLDLCEK